MTAVAKRLEQINPTADRVVVKEDDPDEMVQGVEVDLYVPESAQEQPTMGAVLATGPGARDERTGERRPMTVQPGDRVVYGKWTGTAVETEEEGEVLITREEYILCVLEENGGG